METKVIEINQRERKEEIKVQPKKTNNLSSKNSIKKYVNESVQLYSHADLSEEDRTEICNTLEEYTTDYIRKEARRLTFNSACIKNGRQDKIKVKANMIDICYATGFVVTFIWCFYSNLF